MGRQHTLIRWQSLYCRFIYDDSNDHGLVLVNYSVIAGSVGAIVDASSAAHSLDNILCLLKVPEVPIPTINFTDFEYEINEDNTNDKGFWVRHNLHDQQ